MFSLIRANGKSSAREHKKIADCHPFKNLLFFTINRDHNNSQEVCLNAFSKFILTGFSLFSILSVFSCASITQNDPASQLTIGIWNEFPETPNYIKKQTFIFRHKIAGYDTEAFKQVLTRSVEEYLTSKGYKVIEVQDKAALDNGRADMIVQILPIDIFKQEGTLGYGFYDREILKFVIKQPARSYVCMNMTLHKKGTRKVKRTGRQETFSRLKNKELPDSPDQLTDEQKKEMALTLNKDIEKTVLKALPVLGL